MGEYADMACAESVDSYWDDPEESGWLGGYRSNRTKAKTCKHCGKYPLWWYQDRKFWFLGNAAGVRHTCAEYKSEFGGRSLHGEPKKPVDSDPGLSYNAYLDTIPWETPDEFARRSNRATSRTST